MNSKRAVAQLLKHLSCAGVTHLPKVHIPKPSRIAARARLSGAVAEPSAAAVPATPPPATNLSRSPRQSVEKVAASSTVASRRSPRGLLSSEDIQATAHLSGALPEVQQIMQQDFANLQQKSDALCAVAKSVAACRRCEDLAHKRTQTVFGVGNPNADIMFIGEAPGAEEDAKGEPFVGPAGQLLNKIVEASQLKREDLYICNILRCRPPGNRNPLPQEAVNCREFLDAQIHIIQPRYIICWGTVAAQNLLGKTEAVGKLRGQFFDYHGIKVLCTYHPSYLLRTPAAKKQVWEDMKFFMKDLGVELQ